MAPGYTEHNGNTSVTVSQILMDWSEFFVPWDDIWQTSIKASLTAWQKGGRFLSAFGLARLSPISKQIFQETWQLLVHTSHALPHNFSLNGISLMQHRDFQGRVYYIQLKNMYIHYKTCHSHWYNIDIHWHHPFMHLLYRLFFISWPRHNSCRKGVCRNVQFPHGCLDVSYRSRDESKNPCPCRNCTFPNSVHHQNLESTGPATLCFQGPDDALNWEMCNFRMGPCDYTLSDGLLSKKKIILSSKYSPFLHKTYTIMPTILSAVKRGKLQMLICTNGIIKKHSLK